MDQPDQRPGTLLDKKCSVHALILQTQMLSWDLTCLDPSNCEIVAGVLLHPEHRTNHGLQIMCFVPEMENYTSRQQSKVFCCRVSDVE